ncbi:tape measure protein [Apilactobacillus xinyiensis]|uniref:tape measure protein n=1 Tax=Apilactobacillus xinyiensis TaxID=2841032 RepID=UPI003365240D
MSMIKQSTIGINWALDTNSFSKAQRMTDALKSRFESMDSPIKQANDRFNSMNGNISEAQKRYARVRDMAMEVNGVNGKIARSMGELKDRSGGVTAGFKAMNDAMLKVNSSYKTSLDYADKFNEKTKASVTKVQQLRQSLIDLDRINPKITPEVNTDHAKRAMEKVPKMHVFGGVAAGTVVGNALANTFSNIASKTKEALAAGMQYDQEQQKMNATWTTLTNSAEKAKGMVATVNDLSVKTGQATETVDELEQGFYHLHSNKNESDAMTKSMLNMADAVGLTVPKIQAVTQDMVNGLSRGKANGGMLNQISQYFPMFREQLAKYETSLHHGKEVTTADLATMAKKGQISADDIEKVFTELGNHKYDKAADNMLQTMVGMQRTIHARVPALIGAFEEPIMQAKNPFYGAMSKWVSDKHTQKEFTIMGQAASKGINTITQAFAKAYGLKNGTKTLDNATTVIARGITNMSNAIAQNAPQIKNFFTMTKDTGVLSFKLFAAVMSDVAKITLPFLNFLVKHEKTVVPVLAGLFVTKKALGFASALKEVASSIGLINAAEKANDKTSLLGGILQNNSIAGKMGSKRLNRATESFSTTKNLGSNLSGYRFNAKIAPKESQGAFRTLSEVKAGSQFSKIDMLKNRFSSSMIGSKIAGIGAKIGGSKLLTGAKAIGSKIPYLDVITAGSQLIGMNKKNAGGKIGSAGGMLAGTTGGAAAGAAIGSAVPVIGTGIGGLLGGAIGGIGGSSIGKKIGQSIQKALPKHAFDPIVKAWDKTKSWFGKSIKQIETPFKSAWKSISKSFKPVTDGWHSLQKAFKTKNGEKALHNLGIAAKIGLMPARHAIAGVKVAFKVAMSVIKAAASGIGSLLKNVFGGAFKVVGGIFKTGADVITGRWKHLGKDLSSIGKGLVQILESPFKAIWASIKSIVGDISHAIGSITSKAGNFVKHPIKSIKNWAGFASGTRSRYPNGLTKDTHALVNDGGGREIIRYPSGQMVRPDGTNVHMFLPKGSHVFNAEDSRKLMSSRPTPFAKGTVSLPKSSRAMINSTIHVKYDNHGIRSALLTTKKYTKQITNYISKAYKSINSNSNKELKLMSNGSSRIWKQINKQTTSQLKMMDKESDKISNSLTKSIVSCAKNLDKQLSPIWKDITSDFKSAFSKLSPYAHSGMNGAVNQLNGGIKGIDSALSQFGGNGSVLKPIHYAQGTGAVERDHIAMVNDAKSGPTREAIVNQHGHVRYANGRNALTKIRKGESVLNGHDTLTAINKGYIPHYASGKGSHDALRKLAEQNSKSPSAAWASEFANKIHAGGSTLQKGVTNSASNGAKSVGVPWEKAMWGLISGLASGGSGSKSAFLNYAMQKFTGKPYVLGADGPNAFDCSGMVSKALEHFGINIGRTTTAMQASSGLERIGRNIHKTQAGDIALFGHGTGAAGHVGIVNNPQTGTIFNETPPRARTTPLSYITALPLDAFYRVKGLHNTDAKKGGNGKLDSLVKRQLGNKAMNWISKTLAPDDGGASANPVGAGVERWTDDVKKALGALNLSTSSGMVQKVLAQINTESSGNPNAIGGTDGLKDGRAMGLMQVKPGTFSVYGKPGLGKWNNGYASIYAGLNYAKHRYGKDLSFLGQGHGYAKGGRPPLHKPVMVGENGPEIAEFDSPVKIHSNSESKQMASKLGNSGINFKPTINITVNGGDKNIGKEVARQVKDELYKLLTNQEVQVAFHG